MLTSLFRLSPAPRCNPAQPVSEMGPPARQAWCRLARSSPARLSQRQHSSGCGSASETTQTVRRAVWDERDGVKGSSRRQGSRGEWAGHIEGRG